MTDQRLHNLAQILVRYSVATRPGDDVAIRCPGSFAAAQPLLGQVFREVLKAGAHPHPVIVPGLTEEFDRHPSIPRARMCNWGKPDPDLDLIAHSFQCDIRIMSETEHSPSIASRCHPACPMHFAAHSELIRLYRERSAKHDLRWVVSVLPTTGYAQEVGDELRGVRGLGVLSHLADHPDPASAWSETAPGRLDLSSGSAASRMSM